MRRRNAASRVTTRSAAAGVALVLLVLTGGAGGEDGGDGPSADVLKQRAERWAGRAVAAYRATPPADRITWGGLGACGFLAAYVGLERSLRVRRKRVLPSRFVKRFRDRLEDGRVERAKAADLCELHPCPASRVALAALRRWDCTAPDMERAAAMARQVETDRLRRHVGTLRRVAALSPLIGLLGTLLAAGRALSAAGGAGGTAWGPALAQALAPLTAGVTLAILALVAYDGLVGRIETFSNDLDRLAAETVDAAVMSARAEPRATPARTPHQHHVRVDLPDLTGYDRD